jgi:hypothetical protein
MPRKIANISRERKRETELSSGNWQYQNNLRALTTATLFSFGQLLFKGMFSCTVPVTVAYF